MARDHHVQSHRAVIAILGAALLCLSAELRGAAALPGGTTIDNAVTATYVDANGRAYSTRSNVVLATVAQVGAIVVSPKESKADPATETVAVGQPATRTFVVTNDSNITDAYRVTAFSAGTLAATALKWVTPSGTVSDATQGNTSPSVAPGASIQLQAIVATTRLSVGAQVPVDVTAQTTASGTVNGLQSDSGQEWIVGGSAPQLSGTSGPNTQIVKTVNQATIVQTQPGTVVTFNIAALNSGGSPAQDVVVTDTVPDGLAIVGGSATVNGAPAANAASVSGQTLTVNVGTVGAGQTTNVAFQAEIPATQSIGSNFVNVAAVSANGLPPQETTPAAVLTGSANIVFNGLSPTNAPVDGATVTLLDANGNPVKLSGTSGETVAAQARRVFGAGISGNENPIVTGADGTYGFALPPSDVAANGSTFYLTIHAAGFLDRKIKLVITPGTGGVLYNVVSTSEDKQPLAAAGGFKLTNSDISLPNVFGLFGNLPLFTANPIEVTKTPDRQDAKPGDRIVYTVTFQNNSVLPLPVTTIADTLPPDLIYATGSARLDGNPFEPQISGRTLTWTFPVFLPGSSHTLVYATIVYPDTPAGTTLTNTVSVGGTAKNGLEMSGSANVSVIVTSGPFSDRRVVTGRVFIDAMGTGHFTKGDKGVAGVRVYMEDGTYAVTDERGFFSFPSVRPGMHVLRIDPDTLPPRVRFFDGAAMGSTRSPQRLLHGVLDETTMEDVEFALHEVKK